MNNNKRIEKITKKHFEILDTLEFYDGGELRFFYDYYRLVDKNKKPIINIKRYIIDDLIEHNYIIKNKVNYSINKI